MREPVNQVRGTQSQYIRNHIGFEVLDLAFLVFESSFAIFQWKFGLNISISGIYDIKVLTQLAIKIDL